jgi:endonuclease/exonuclease/phosphatase family metal-dependent hydrolase
MRTLRGGGPKYNNTKKKKPLKFSVMSFNVESWLNLIKPIYNASNKKLNASGHPILEDGKVDYLEDKTHDLREEFKAYLSSPKGSPKKGSPKGSSSGSSDSSRTFPTRPREKWENLKKIFNGVDILCIQEDALMGVGRNNNPETYEIYNSSQENFISQIQPAKGKMLHLVSSCKSHPYRWDDTQGLFYSGSKLSNTIYSKYNVNMPTLSIAPQLKNDIDREIKSTIDTDGKIHPRCWSINEIHVSPTKSVKVASIHLTGGRYDDIASLTDNNFIIKIRQIYELLNESPDIICGDFNTKIVPPPVDNYFLDLPFQSGKVRDYLATNPMSTTKDMSKIYESIRNHIMNGLPLMEISLVDKWHIWMYGLHYVFEQALYKSVFNDDPPETTIFGGTVDMIYYSSIKLLCNRANVVKGVIDMSIPVSTYPDYSKRKILSDHAPIKAVFSFIE